LLLSKKLIILLVIGSFISGFIKTTIMYWVIAICLSLYVISLVLRAANIIRSGNRKLKRSSKIEMRLIDSKKGLNLQDILNQLDELKELGIGMIITDPKIVSSNDYRRQIHDKCRNLDMTSQKMKPSGAQGVFLSIRPESPIIACGLTKDELEMFVRMARISIDKRLLSSKRVFSYKMKIQNEFDEKHGKPGSKTAYEFFDMFLEVKTAAVAKGLSIQDFVGQIERKVIEHIKAKEGYTKFSTEKIETKKGKKIGNMQGTNPYKVGVKEFWGISIDIKSANFNVLRLYDGLIVDGSKTWIEFMKQFTDLEFFGYAKTFRQQVLGKLNAKRIQGRQKDLLKSIVQPLQDIGISIDGNINSDEIIISVNQDDESIPHEMVFDDAWEMQEKIVEVLNASPYPDIWRVEVFRVQPLIETPETVFYPFVRDTFTDHDDMRKFWTQFRCVSKVYMTQVINFWKKGKVDNGDLLFADEFGNIHTFDYPIIQ